MRRQPNREHYTYFLQRIPLNNTKQNRQTDLHSIHILHKQGCRLSHYRRARRVFTCKIHRTLEPALTPGSDIFDMCTVCTTEYKFLCFLVNWCRHIILKVWKTWGVSEGVSIEGFVLLNEVKHSFSDVVWWITFECNWLILWLTWLVVVM